MRTLPTVAMLVVATCVGQRVCAQLLAPPAAPAPAASPLLGNAAISFDRTTHDFGEVLDDVNVDTTFRFTNTGDTTLEILDHRATCGCTVPEISKRSLLPGESATIKVVFHPAHKKGMQHQTVTLLTNARDQEQVQLVINANVKQMTWTEPAVAHFSRIDKGDPRAVVIEVLSRVPGFKVESVAVTNEVVFRAEVGEASEVKSEEGEIFRKYPVRVTLAPTVPIGNHSETIAIRTNDPKKPVVQQQVIAEVLGDLVPNPNRISLGVVRPGDPLRAEFRVTSRSGKPFKILKSQVVPANAGNLVVEVEAMSEGGTPEVKVVLTGTAPNAVQPIRGKIEFTTDNKDQPKVEVPFYATVRGGGR